MSGKEICLLALLAAGSCGLANANAEALAVTLNGRQTDFPVERDNQSWRFQYQRQLQEQDGLAAWGAELDLAPNAWKQHPQHPHIRGCNGDVRVKILAPGPVVALSAQARITNYADSRSRVVSLAYSLNGYEYQPLGEETFTGAATLAGEATLAGHRGPIWLRLQRQYDKDDANGRHGYVLLSDFSLRLDGEMPVPATDATVASPAPSYRLQDVFPTGVFWPWERTRPNAELAGMELWAFVEQTMQTLQEHHCNALWFVNIGPGEDARHLLALAEKYHLRVLLNTSLLTFFYNGIGLWEDIDRQARRTVNDIADFPALLGYVLKDEPLLCSVAQLSHLSRVMKKHDPLKRDSVAVVMNRQTQTYLEDSALPVICTDIYYFGHDLSTNIPNPAAVSQQEFRHGVKGMNAVAARRGKHSWLMPQMFGDVWGRHYQRGDKMVVEPGAYLHWRMPTDAETRWQIWEGLRLGSKGVIFYVLFPPIPLFKPPADAAPDSPEAKSVERMDRLAAQARSWQKQPLTETEMEIDPGQGVLQPGGRPTPQMAAMADAFRVIRQHDGVLTRRQAADFPVFFASDPETEVATFLDEERPEVRFGIVVNSNLESTRQIQVLLPPNITRIVDLGSGRELAVTAAEPPFQACQLTLAPGDGVLLQAEFARQDPGALFFRENFAQHDQHKVKLNADSARLVRFGSFGMFPFYGVTQAGSGEKPVFIIENLSSRKSAVNTILMNLNSTREQGTVFCRLEGKLAGVRLYALGGDAGEGQQTNVMHLQEKNLDGVGARPAASAVLLQDRDFHRPVRLPVGTTALQVFMDPEQKDALISDVTIWFAPR